MRSAVSFKVRLFVILSAEVINKHLRMNASINLVSLTDALRLQNISYLDKLTI